MIFLYITIVICVYLLYITNHVFQRFFSLDITFLFYKEKVHAVNEFSLIVIVVRFCSGTLKD